MDSILGRSHFVSETAQLFTDEKTANARAKVVEWINELSTAEPQTKCEILVKVQETILGSCIELLEEFLEPLLALSHDTNMEVRKQVAALIEQICKTKIELLPQVITVVSMLLRDRSPQVIKRVIQACGSIYKNGLQWMCSHSEVTDTGEQAWSVLSLIKAQILDLIDNDNDGIRTNAIKFLEGIVVLQSYSDEDSQKRENDFSLQDVPENLKFIKRQKLEAEAFNIFDILLKYYAATHISSVNLIACTGSLCTIAKLRPSLMGPVVEAFKSVNANLPPTLTDSQISSVRKFTKMQLMQLIKNRGSYEFQGTIRHLLLDLGCTQSEINRALPKMDKQEQSRRQKRILENAASNLSKRLRLDSNTEQSPTKPSNKQQEMEIDEEELDKQLQKSNKVNEKFLSEHLRLTEVAVQLVLEFLPKLPDEVPPQFLEEYTPIREMTFAQQVAKIANLLGSEMSKQKIGPGAAAFTKEPPMRPKRDEPMEAEDDVYVEQTRKEEATKKLRENMERAKDEQELIERMKQRAKTLKLQEITKPFSRTLKDKFLEDAVARIMQSERQCIVGGVAAKRRKILTVIAATFPDKVRYSIFDFLMLDIKHRIDQAFSWLYEEYCLLQGFTRHSYIKSENRPDHAYNELLGQLIRGIKKNCEFKDKIALIRRVFLEAPLLPEDAITQLVVMCLEDDMSPHCVDLIKDLAVLRPPRKNKFISILLTFCVHERAYLRERALDHIIVLYHQHKLQTKRIDSFAVEWASHLQKDVPPASIFGEKYGRNHVETGWKEESTKICLQLMLTLLPYQPDVYLDKLCQIYTDSKFDIRRTILRCIDSCMKKLGPDNPDLLRLIDNCPPGAESLVIRMIHMLTERVATPHPDLMAHVRDWYTHKMKDVRVLIPVINGLTRQEILAALPKFIRLSSAVVKDLFNRLLGIGAEFANQTIAVTPTDILVALHTIDINACELKYILKATSLCMAEKEVYTKEVLIGVLQQLVDIVPIPTLLMRTIMQSITLYPDMVNFVLNLMQRLILKQVWREKLIWEGFLKCLQRLKPQSLPIMLQLPAQHLMDALQKCPELRAPLLEYAESIQDEPMSGITPQIMDIINGKAVDVFVTDESGGYISIEHIKQEIEDPDFPTVIGTVPVLAAVPAPVPATLNATLADPRQPLPPGED